MKFWKLIIVSGLYVASLTLGTTVMASEHSIRIALPSWDAGKIIAYDLASIVKEKTNSSVEFVDIEGDVIWEMLASDEGKIDIFPDIWLPNQQKFFDDYVVNKKSVNANVSPYKGDQGFYAILPDGKQTADLSIKDLSKPEIVNLFDTDGNGKAEFWPGAEGWHSTLYSRVKMKDYELQGNWEQISATNEELQNLLEARSRANQGLLFYYWSPEAIHAKYQPVKVKEAEYEKGCKKFVEPKNDKNWLSKSSFKCAYQVATIHILFNDKISNDERLGWIFKNYEVNANKLQNAMLSLQGEGIDLASAAKLLH